jgi:xylulokinase
MTESVGWAPGPPSGLPSGSQPGILAIDVGTSSLKAALYDLDGQILATGSRRYGYHTERAGWAEGEPAAWWAALGAALADLRGQGADLGRVVALACTGQMHSAVLLDAAGDVIPPTILWLDRRAGRETEELQTSLRLPPYQLNSTMTLPKLLWLRRHRPELWAGVAAILWPKDYLRYRLTGVICTDMTEACGAALLDWERREWAEERLELLGLDRRVLPPILPAEADAGRLKPDVAAALGLNPAARVLVGMGDVAALFGGAPLRPGRVVCSLGSSSMIFAPLPAGSMACDPAGRIYVYPFGPTPMLGGVSSTTGAALTWAYEQIGQWPKLGVKLEDAIEEALAVEPGVGGLCFIPYLAGERSPYWSDDIRGGFYGLRLGHAAPHLLRAVMEGVAFSLRCLLDIYAEAGAPIDEIALAAGGTLTAGWPQMIADVCQREVAVYAGQETVTRVLYALCRSALGLGGFEESLAGTFGAPRRCAGRRELAEVYAAGYRRYRAFADFAAAQP